MSERTAPPSAPRVLGPGVATCEVFTCREGVLSAVGHDLRLRVEAFELTVDPAAPAVSARFDAASLRVDAALRDGQPLAGALRPADVRDIEAAIAAEVLDARRFPEIRFASSEVARTEHGYAVRGTLTLRGVARPLAVRVGREGDRLVAEVALHQPEFGIRPYSAMLGALRVKPGVRVRLSLPSAGLR